MGNCLKTQLKEMVNNDNLKKLNEFKLFVKQGQVTNPSRQQRLIISAINPIVIRVNKSGYFATSVEGLVNDPKTSLPVEANTATTLYFANGNYEIFISDKYSVRYFTFGENIKSIISADMEELEYMNSLEYLTIMSSDSYGDISNLKHLNKIKELYVNSTLISGDINELQDTFGNLQNIQFSNTSISGDLTVFANSNVIEYIVCNNTGIYGDISSLNKASIKNIVCNGCLNVTGDISSLGASTSLKNLIVYNSGVTGSFESFVASQVSNGRSICDTLYVPAGLTIFTFGGEKHLDVSGMNILTWESASKIAIFVGDSVAEAATVYCKGYTQQEAETKWSGKTIIRVDA